MRKVWMFPLRAKEHTITVDESHYEHYVKTQEKKAKRLSKQELEARAKEHSSTTAANRAVTSRTYVRDPYVAQYSKERAHGICQLCGRPAPFIGKDGKPYLESHHVIWLSNGGADSIDNTVALCPNCHRKMHVINDPADQQKLLEKAKE